MSKIFICDNCGKEYPHPLDEQYYRDQHGVEHMFDLCAPCRKLLEEQKQTTILKGIAEKRNNG